MFQYKIAPFTPSFRSIVQLLLKTATRTRYCRYCAVNDVLVSRCDATLPADIDSGCRRRKYCLRVHYVNWTHQSG